MVVRPAMVASTPGEILTRAEIFFRRHPEPPGSTPPLAGGRPASALPSGLLACLPRKAPQSGVVLPTKKGRDSSSKWKATLVTTPPIFRLLQRPPHPCYGFRPIAPPGYHLGQKGVVIGRHDVAWKEVGVHPDAGPAWRDEAVYRPGARSKTPGRILGIHTAFYRVSAEKDIFLADIQSAPPPRYVSAILPGRSPCIISDTGCSTWIRVFISMKL